MIDSGGYAKMFFQKSLSDWKAPQDSSGLSYLPLSSMNRGLFVSVFRRVVTHSTSRDLECYESEKQFDALIARAGDAHNPIMWECAFLGERAVGLVLAQRLQDRPDTGTVFFVGVMPEFRGRGWGHVLHTRGLKQLAQAGVTRYEGSTDVFNKPMRRVFEHNHCEPIGVRQFDAKGQPGQWVEHA